MYNLIHLTREAVRRFACVFSIRRCFAAASALVFMCATTSVAQAQAAPAVKLATAPLVAPADAWTYYGTGPTHTPGVAAWSSRPPEITALSRSLGAERYASGAITADQFAQNAVEYVRNNIGVEFRFGLGKGARGAVIDLSGTPFDQANLMVEILRQGSVSATYEVGTVTLTAQQFGQWTGLINGLNQSAQTFTVDAKAACQLLADGGIPALVNGANACGSLTGNLTTVTLAHIWVLANGKRYDPSFKPHTFKTGIDIPAAMGCGTASAPTCAPAVKTAATPVVGTVTGFINGSPYIQNISESGVTGQMQTFATSLQHTIEANIPVSELDDVVGGGRVDSTYSPVATASLPYSYATQASWTGDIPDQYRSTLRVQFMGLDQTFFADEVAGRRVRAFYDTPGEELFADNQLIATAPCSSCTGSTTQTGSITLSANHPYAANGGSYADETSTLFVGSIVVPVTIISAWGDSAPSTQQYFAELQKQDPTPFKVSGTTNCTVTYNKDCRADDQPIMAAQFLSQQGQAKTALAAVGHSNISLHHQLGVVSQEFGYSTTAPVNFTQGAINLHSLISVNPTTVSSSSQTQTFAAFSALSSMLEGSLFQQTNDGWEPISSTAGFVLANRKGYKILDVASTNLSTVLPSLTSYGSDRQARLLSLAGTGLNLMLPQNGELGCTAILGANICVSGGPELGYSADTNAYMLSELFKGGTAVSAVDPVAEALAASKQANYSLNQKKYASVSPASGSLTLSPPADIVTGSGQFPFSLPFERKYTSSTAVTEVAMYGLCGTCAGTPGSWHQYRYDSSDGSSATHIGNGWTNNYSVTANLSNNADANLGLNSGVEASSLIAATQVIYDGSADTTLAGRLTSIFSTYWLSQQFIANSVTVNRGGTVEVFTKLPDGRYNAPAGSQAQISLSVNRFGPLAQGTSAVFIYGSLALTYKAGDGTTIAFTPGHYLNSNTSLGWIALPELKADTITAPNGVKVSFTYSVQTDPTGVGSDRRYALTQVSNSFGRSLTFGLVPSPVNSSGDGVLMGWRINTVTDETGRQVSYSTADCPNVPLGQYTAFFTCNTFSVTLPDSSVLKYGYVPDGSSPDPSVMTRPEYHVRRWYVPSDQSTPTQTTAYDDLFRVASMSDRLSHTSRYYTSSVSRETYFRAEVVDPASASEVSYFDKYGDRLRLIDALGRISTWGYDGLHRQILQTEPEGNCATSTYDIRNNLLSAAVYPKGSCQSPGTALVIGTSYGEAASVLTCLNQVTCNKPFSETDARGNTTSYQWDSATGNLTQVLKPADLSGNRPETDIAYTGFTGADGATVFLPTLKTEAITKSGGSITSSLKTAFAYNTGNKLVLQSATVDAVSGGLNLTTNLGFDAVGNLVASTDPRGNAASFIWDVNRRLTYLVQPAIAGVRLATRSRYSLDGETVAVDKGTTTLLGPDFSTIDSVFSPLQSVTFAYDLAGNKIQTTVLDGTTTPALSITQTSYDVNDRPLCNAVRTNPASYASLPSDACTLSTQGSFGPDRITKTIYDVAGQSLQTIQGLGTVSQRTYSTTTWSLNGKELTVRDANSNLTTFEYDGFDRLVKERFPVPGLGQNQSSATDYESYAYDANGNRISLRKRDNSVIGFSFDALNRMTIKDTPGGTVNDVYNSYDLMDRPTAVLFGSTSGSGITYNYDTAERLTGETTFGRTMTYALDPAGNRTRVTWPDAGGFFVGYSYDARNRTTDVCENLATCGSATTIGGGLIARYAYDPLGRRASLTRGNGTSTTFIFDNADRMTQLNQAVVTTAANQGWTFTYNPASQKVSRTSSNALYDWTNHPPQTTAKTFDGLNRDATIAALSGGYDANGNLTTEGSGGRTFTYDYENRLLNVTGVSQPVTLSYDPSGRLQQIVGAATTQFLYDASRLSAEYVGSSSTVLRRYVHGPGTDEPILWYEGAGTADRRWLHADAQGSIIAWSDGAGSVTSAASQVYAYGPYGEPQNPAWGGSRFAYTGQIQIPEAKLYHYKARAYDPLNGRFLQTDPVGYRADLDLYTYAGDDPENEVDPTGLFPIWIEDMWNVRVEAYPGPAVPKGQGVPHEHEPGHIHLSDRNGQNETRIRTDTWEPLDPSKDKLTPNQRKWLKSLGEEERAVIKHAQGEVYSKGRWTLNTVLRTIRDMAEKGAREARADARARAKARGEEEPGRGDNRESRAEKGWRSTLKRIMKSARGGSDDE